MNTQVDEVKTNGQLALRNRDVALGKSLADLAKAFKQTFADEEQAIADADRTISDAKHYYQVQRIDIIHEVLLRNGGDRQKTIAWALKNGPVKKTQVGLLLQAESKMYRQTDDSKAITRGRPVKPERLRQSIATKGLEPTLYPRRSTAEEKAVERELEAQRRAAESPQELVFDLATRRRTAIELLNAGHRLLSKEHHPDVGGSNDRQRILNDAKSWAKEIIERSL